MARPASHDSTHASPSPFRMIASPNLQAVRSFGRPARDPFFPTYALPSPGRRLLVAPSRHAYVDPVNRLRRHLMTKTRQEAQSLLLHKAPAAALAFVHHHHRYHRGDEAMRPSSRSTRSRGSRGACRAPAGCRAHAGFGPLTRFHPVWKRSDIQLVRRPLRTLMVADCVFGHPWLWVPLNIMHRHARHVQGALAPAVACRACSALRSYMPYRVSACYSTVLARYLLIRPR